MTKNQHYVPRLLLRNFAHDERVDVYDLVREECRLNQHINGVCSENYLYDHDNLIENFLATKIEGPAAAELKKLETRNFDLRRPSTEWLTFLLAQLMRTPEAFDKTESFMQSAMNNIISSIYSVNNWEGRQCHFQLDGPGAEQAVLSSQVVRSPLQVPLISDLAACILQNDTSDEFIISDHPVFHSNWYLKDADDPRVAGIATKGVQFFLPISPTLTYCLYDAKVYAYRGRSGHGVISVTKDDVAKLNHYQVANARAFIVARPGAMQTKFTSLVAAKNSMKSSSVTTENSTPYYVDGELRQMYMTYVRLPSTSSMPTFIRIKKKIGRQDVKVGYRNDELCLEHEKWMQSLKSRDH